MTLYDTTPKSTFGSLELLWANWPSMSMCGGRGLWSVGSAHWFRSQEGLTIYRGDHKQLTSRLRERRHIYVHISADWQSHYASRFEPVCCTLARGQPRQKQITELCSRKAQTRFYCTLLIKDIGHGLMSSRVVWSRLHLWARRLKKRTKISQTHNLYMSFSLSQYVIFANVFTKWM